MITKNFGPLTIRFPGIVKADGWAAWLYNNEPPLFVRVSRAALVALIYAEEENPLKGLTLDLKALNDPNNYKLAIKHLYDMGANDDDILKLGYLIADWFKEQAAKPLSEAEKQASFFGQKRAL